MARCSCGNATCSCIIKGETDGGILVTGNGSPTRPYLLSLEEGGNPLNNIVFDDTPSLDMSTTGNGTAASKLHVSGVAKPKMTELRDVVDASGPANGEVPVWRTDHWQFEAQTGSGGGGGGGSPSASAIYTRKGALSFPASTQTPIPWDTVSSAAAGIAFNGTDTFTITTTGFYQITCALFFAAAVNTGYYQIRIIRNGVIWDYRSLATDDNIGQSLQIARVMSLAAGDTIQIAAYCNPASSLIVTPTFYTNDLQIVRLDSASTTDPALPAPVDTYNGADQTIVNTARPGETPSTVRSTMTNPHPTKRMLVEMFSQGWVQVTGASAAIALYYEYLTVSGSISPAQPLYCSREDSLVGAVTGATFYKSMYGRGLGWIDAAATAVLGVAVTRAAAGGGTVIARYNHLTITPIRYE